MASLDPRHILRHRVCRRSYVAHASAPRKLSDACREYRIDLCHRTVGFRECPQQTVWDKKEYLIGGRAATSRSRARAVFQRPSLLLPDEATSPLDAPTERRIVANLAHHFSNQTILFISHRIAALR